MKQDLKRISGTISVILSLFVGLAYLISSHVSPGLLPDSPIIASNTSTSTNVAAVGALSHTPGETVETYPVTKVVDGDTIVVKIGDTEEHIRLIGVNTPETVDPRKKVQCFGAEASAWLKNVLASTSVTLVADPTQEDRDRYGRLLRYVYLDDTLINGEIIQAGYGYEYTYQKPYQMQKEFKDSENYARLGGIGLWATSTCNGKL